MSKINVLVTGIGGDIGRNIVRCLKDSGYDMKITGCDIDEYASGRTLVDAFIKAPRAKDEPEYAAFLKNCIKTHNIRYIYPSTEIEIEFFSRNRETFKGAHVFINNKLIIDTFLDKYKTAEFLEKNKILHPRTFLARDYSGQLKFPVVLKERKGCGGRGVEIAENEEDLKFYLKKYKDAVVQEYVGRPDDEYTMAVFSDGRNVNSICFRRQLGEWSFSKLVELVQDSQAQKLAEQIAGLCNLKGTINIQMRKIGSKYSIFEINPRISSTVYFRHYFGFQDVKWWMDMQEEKPISYKLKYGKGVGARAIDEVFFNLTN